MKDALNATIDFDIFARGLSLQISLIEKNEIDWRFRLSFVTSFSVSLIFSHRCFEISLSDISSWDLLISLFLQLTDSLIKRTLNNCRLLLEVNFIFSLFFLSRRCCNDSCRFYVLEFFMWYAYLSYSWRNYHAYFCHETFRSFIFCSCWWSILLYQLWRKLDW